MLSRATTRSAGVLAVMARCHPASLRATGAIGAKTTTSKSRMFSSKIINPYFVPLFPSNAKPTTKSTTSTSNDPSDPPPNCDVVQGPSLLRTPAQRPHPTLMFLPGLRSLPFWTSDAGPVPASQTDAPPRRRIAYNDPSVTRAVQYLEQHADTIREEYLRVAPSLPSDYENTQDHTPSGGAAETADGKDTKLHDGEWDWHTYLSKGNVRGEFVSQFPETSRILQEGFRGEGNNYQLFEGTPFGFCFFSNLGAGAKIAAHNAPTNLRLRIHLPIAVGDENNEGVDAETGLPRCGIRVAASVRSYQQDNAIVLDDAYDHEVWNNTPQNRVVLLVDIWHPDVTQAEKEAVVEMFQQAKRDGLWKR